MAEFRLPLDYKEKVGRAVHDIPTIKRTTLLPGTLIPLYARRMKRGETFIYSTPQALLQSLPTLAPVLGGWRLRLEWYFNSDANHYGWIDNNSRLSPQDLLQRKHHTFSPNLVNGEDIQHLYLSFDAETYDELGTLPYTYRAFLNKYGVGKGSLMDFMGVAPGTIPSDSVDQSVLEPLFTNSYNLDFILTYLNIVRCYHVNQQFPQVPFIKYKYYLNENIINRDVYGSFSQKDLDDLFMFLRYCENGTHFRSYINRETLNIDLMSASSIQGYVGSDIPQRYRSAVTAFVNYLRCVGRENAGLFCSQYMPDLYRNLLNNDADLLKSEVTVDGDGNFSIETFRFQNRLQLIYDRIQPFGGKDSTISRTRWGVKSNRDYDIPELINVQTEFIDTSSITSTNAGTAQSGDGEITSVPGDLSGYTNSRRFIKGKQKFTANTPGTLMCIVSLVPQVDYCQNVEPHLTTFMFEDEYSPQMAQRGFESVPMQWYCSLPNIGWSQTHYLDGSQPWISSFSYTNDGADVIGKQVAWLNDISSVNRVHGEFTRFGELDYWVLSRDFMDNKEEVDRGEMEETAYTLNVHKFISPYVDPLKWQYMFVAQTLKDPNWYLQVMFDVKTVSPVGYRFMPTLE